MKIKIKKHKHFLDKINFSFNGFRICGLNLLNICGMDFGSTGDRSDPLHICMNDVDVFYEDKFEYGDSLIFGFCKSCKNNSYGKEMEFVKTGDDLIRYLENIVFV